VAVAAFAASFVEAPASADSGHEGRYRFAKSTTVAAPLGVDITMEGLDGPITTWFECILPEGLQSDRIFCDDLDVELEFGVGQQTQYEAELIVDFLPFQNWAHSEGINLLGVDAADGGTQKAEAEWVGWPDGWVRVLAEDGSDQAKCNEKCGDEGGSVSAKPTTNSMNAFAEPQCTVTCVCASGAKKTWQDPPEILASGW